MCRVAGFSPVNAIAEIQEIALVGLLTLTTGQSLCQRRNDQSDLLERISQHAYGFQGLADVDSRIFFTQ